MYVEGNFTKEEAKIFAKKIVELSLKKLGYKAYAIEKQYDDHYKCCNANDPEVCRFCRKELKHLDRRAVELPPWMIPVKRRKGGERRFKGRGQSARTCPF